MISQLQSESHYTSSFSSPYFSCKEKEISIVSTNPFIGDWSLILDSARAEDWYRNTRSGKGKLYSFINDSVVDTKTFYKEPWSENYDECKENKIFDSKTKYKFYRDTLIILNPENLTWDSIGKIRVSKDTLKIYRGNLSFVYTRQSYPFKDIGGFDQVVVSSSPCFGTCPVIDISINADGMVYYNGRGFVENLGFHNSKISKELFNEIKLNFAKADFLHLDNEYHAGWTCDFTVSITFLKEVG